MYMHVIYWYLQVFSYHCDHCDLSTSTDITDIDISNLVDVISEKRNQSIGFKFDESSFLVT